MLLYCAKLWNTDSGFYLCIVTKLMNSNTYSIITYSISCNTNSYYSIIIITVYQTYPKEMLTKLKVKCDSWWPSSPIYLKAVINETITFQIKLGQPSGGWPMLINFFLWSRVWKLLSRAASRTFLCPCTTSLPLLCLVPVGPSTKVSHLSLSTLYHGKPIRNVGEFLP